MAKLAPGTMVEGVSRRIVENAVRYKVKFKHYSEIESGWVSRDFTIGGGGDGSNKDPAVGGDQDIDSVFLSFSCLEAKLNESSKEKLSMEQKSNILKQLSFAAILHAPMSSVHLWLDTLCCFESTLGEPSVSGSQEEEEADKDPWSKLLNKNGGGGGGGVCGYLFKRGDMAWNCRTCQQDATCVQCDACFRRSDHRGHDVFFHATSPGGCCDCGDPEAWADAGCCDLHKQKTKTSQETSEDSSPTIPDHIVNNTKEVIVVHVFYSWVIAAYVLFIYFQSYCYYVW
jgi:hypothetical protein